jgi:LysM repeat protein
MQWEKKICVRITLRRIVVALLVASIVANLIIVGAVLGADSLQPAPTITSTWTSDPRTATFLVATATAGEATVTQIVTNTETPTDTPTATQTPTNTDLPTVTSCVMRFDWLTYRVKRGDTLFSIAVATGSTVRELMDANCLTSDRIFAGQLLYVPRLPIPPTLTYTPTSDTPTGFMILATMTCDAPSYVSFAVSAYDPDAILSITVLVYSSPGILITEIPLAWNGTNYSGWTTLSEYTVADIAYYQFRAVDSLTNVTTSPSYSERSSSCMVLQ